VNICRLIYSVILSRKTSHKFSVVQKRDRKGMLKYNSKNLAFGLLFTDHDRQYHRNVIYMTNDSLATLHYRRLDNNLILIVMEVISKVKCIVYFYKLLKEKPMWVEVCRDKNVFPCTDDHRHSITDRELYPRSTLYPLHSIGNLKS